MIIIRLRVHVAGMGEGYRSPSGNPFARLLPIIKHKNIRHC